ncbi:MAG: FtsW/RodA/SpoVE family cell cycle protein [Abditibacteriales bacterium]|nr:FtsW/RodA/SpoVE family cell cycle protein [Abditibacteriales bacterium]MDW8367692.1 FtsW/RodA/SpoVE family cell cycle protein [Abditibacteriales bacterium]
MRSASALRQGSDWSLLSCAVVIGLGAFALVHLTRTTSWDNALLVPLVGMAGFVAVELYLTRRKIHHDPLLLPLVALLVGLGLALLYHVKPQVLGQQAISLLLGLVTLAATCHLRDVRALTRYKYTLMLLGIALLLLVIFAGHPLGAREVRLGIRVGAFSFQPSELVRILLVIFLAGFLAEKREVLAYGARGGWQLSRADMRYLGPMMVLWGLVMLLLIRQQDLGMALLFFGIFLAMLYLAGARAVYLIIGITAFALGAYLAYRLFPHVRTRFDIWLNPWADIDNKGYQIVQSLFALSGGGLLGAGLGQGGAHRVPAVHTDLIFAAAAEELGLLGATAILLVFALIAYRGYRIACRARDDVSVLMAGGLTTALALQVLIIVGGVVKMTPLTGVTLPFMSYGGSSLISNFLLIGLLLVISGESPMRR